MAAVQVSQLNPWTISPPKTRSSSLCWLVPTPVVSYWRSPVSKTLLSIYLLQSPNSLEVSSGIGSLTGQKETLHLHLPSDPETDRTSPPVQISLAPGFSVGIKEYKTLIPTKPWAGYPARRLHGIPQSAPGILNSYTQGLEFFVQFSQLPGSTGVLQPWWPAVYPYVLKWNIIRELSSSSKQKMTIHDIKGPWYTSSNCPESVDLGVNPLPHKVVSKIGRMLKW